MNAMMLIGRNTASTTRFVARLNDGTNSYASGAGCVLSLTSSYTNIAVTTILTYGATSTLSWQGASAVVNCFIRQQPFDNGAGATASTATRITATKLA